MRRFQAGLLLVLIACAARGSPGVAGSPSTDRSSSSVASPTPSPAPTSEAAIRVGRLPSEGIALQTGHQVVLLDVDGRLLARVPGATLAYPWDVPGSVVVRIGDTDAVLRVEAGVLEPLPDARSAQDLDPQFQDDVALPRPEGAVAGAGRWAYALPGPGGLTLAQWSGECEAPNAMFVPAGGAPRAVTGEAGLRGPESQALGWDDRGRAIVWLREGECGTSFARPGIYAFTAPGSGVPISIRSRIAGARMWGSAA